MKLSIIYLHSEQLCVLGDEGSLKTYIQYFVISPLFSTIHNTAYRNFKPRSVINVFYLIIKRRTKRKNTLSRRIPESNLKI